ncbi:stealth conserved region 3 domain-containing protein [Phaeovulum sp.]|uniref:stealth conserved region 3 domain-containing protein n=1 Tax=Phaeovulum sp. TaxID=2934796 RepID=UPI0039E32F7F
MKTLFSHSVNKGFTVKDYAMAAVGSPALFKYAARRVLRQRARAVESAIRASENKALRSVAPELPPSLDQLIDGLARHMGVLVLERGTNSAEIGVAEVDLLSALLYLKSNALQSRMQIGSAAVNFGTKNFKSRALAAPFIRLKFSDDALNDAHLTIEPYYNVEPGKWLSNNSRNLTARALYTDILETPGVHDAVTLLSGSTLYDRALTAPVDVVYTWVNHNDPAWAALFDECRPDRADEQPQTPSTQSADADALSRFHSNDELRFSLRSVMQNLAWVNKIYVFTNCAKPDWLAKDSDRLVWVQHSDVIAGEHLPTFNSHVIESYLHRIPGLCENFIYINDDVFVARPLAKDFFFDANGASRSFLEPYGMVSGAIRVGDPDYLNAARNSARVIHSALGFVPTQLHRHTTFALRRSVLEEIEIRFGDEISQMRTNRFRSPTDMNLTSFFYHHYAYGTGRAAMATCSSAFVKSLDIRWKAQLEAAANPALQIICINEGGTEKPAANWHSAVQRFLSQRFPNKAPWER